MNKKAILAASATVGVVTGAILFAKKKGWNPIARWTAKDKPHGESKRPKVPRPENHPL